MYNKLVNISRTTVIKITVFGILFYQLLDKEYVEYILEQSLQNENQNKFIRFSKIKNIFIKEIFQKKT